MTAIIRHLFLYMDLAEPSGTLGVCEPAEVLAPATLAVYVWRKATAEEEVLFTGLWSLR